MRPYLLLLALLLMAGRAYGAQDGVYLGNLLFIGQRDCNKYVLEKKEWITQSVDVEGSTQCIHSWAESKIYNPKSGIGCLVDHNGGHCSWNDDWRDRICRHCGRLEKQEEIWHETWVACPPEPKTEFEELKEKFDPAQDRDALKQGPTNYWINNPMESEERQKRSRGSNLER